MGYCKCRVCGLGYDDDNPEDVLIHVESHTHFIRTSTLYLPEDARKDSSLLEISLSMQCIDLLNYATRIHKTSCYHYENNRMVVSVLGNHYLACPPIKEWELLCRKKLAQKKIEYNYVRYEITPTGFKLLSLIHNIPLRVADGNTDETDPEFSSHLSEDGINRMYQIDALLHDNEAE